MIYQSGNGHTKGILQQGTRGELLERDGLQRCRKNSREAHWSSQQPGAHATLGWWHEFIQSCRKAPSSPPHTGAVVHSRETKNGQHSRRQPEESTPWTHSPALSSPAAASAGQAQLEARRQGYLDAVHTHQPPRAQSRVKEVQGGPGGANRDCPAQVGNSSHLTYQKKCLMETSRLLMSSWTTVMPTSKTNSLPLSTSYGFS